MSNPWFQVVMGVMFHILVYLTNTWKTVTKNKNRPGFVAAESRGKSLYRGVSEHEGYDTRRESRCPLNGSKISFLRALKFWEFSGITTFVRYGSCPGTVTWEETRNNYLSDFICFMGPALKTRMSASKMYSLWNTCNRLPGLPSW